MDNIYLKCDCGSSDFYFAMKEVIDYRCKIIDGTAYVDDNEGTYNHGEFPHKGFCNSCFKETELTDAVWE